LEVIAGKDEYDSTCSSKPSQPYSQYKFDANKKYKIAYFHETLHHNALDAEIKKSIENFIDKIKMQGHTVTPLQFNLLEYVVPTYYILTTAEASSNLSRYDGVKYGFAEKKQIQNIQDFYKATRSNGFGKEVKRRIMLGTFVLSAGYYNAYFTKAQQVRNILYSQTQELFKNFDMLISPTVPAPAFKFGEKSNDPVEMFLGDIYTVFANLTGIPAISIPLFQHSNGMPFGLQLMSKQFDDAALLQASQMMMQI